MMTSTYDRSIDSIANSSELKNRWGKYQGDNIFAKDILQFIYTKTV